MRRRWAPYSLNVLKLTKPGRHLNNYSTACPLIFNVCLLPLYTVQCLTYHTVRPPSCTAYPLLYTVPLTYCQIPFSYCPSPLLQTVHPPYCKLSVPPFYILSFPSSYILSVPPLAHLKYILRLSIPP